MLRRYWTLLVDYLRPQRGRVVALALLPFAGIAFQLINSQIVRRFIDGATSGSAQSGLIGLVVLFMAPAIAQQVFSVIAAYLAETVGWMATNELRGDLADRLLRLDMGFHKSHTPGELIERIDGDITALSNFFSQFVIHVAGNLVLLLGVLVLLFRESLWIGFGISLFAVAALAGMVGIQSLAMPWWKLVRQKSAEFYGFLGEQVGGTEDVRANGGVAFVIGRFTATSENGFRYRFAALWAGRICGRPILSCFLRYRSHAEAGDIFWNEHLVDHPATFFVPPRSAYTPQIPLLFSMSLRDNHAMGLPVDDDAIAAATVVQCSSPT